MTDKMTIRNIDPYLYTLARVTAVENRCTVGEIINEALEDWFVPEDDNLQDDQSVR